MWHGPVSLVRWFAWSLPIVPRRGHASLCGYPVFKSAKETVRHQYRLLVANHRDWTCKRRGRFRSPFQDRPSYKANLFGIPELDLVLHSLQIADLCDVLAQKGFRPFTGPVHQRRIRLGAFLHLLLRFFQRDGIVS